jgi:glycine cleavage system regulatory protein
VPVHVLASQGCNIVEAEVWTHDRRAAAVVQVTDQATGLAVRDAGRLSEVQELLANVMQGDGVASPGRAAAARARPRRGACTG